MENAERFWGRASRALLAPALLVGTACGPSHFGAEQPLFEELPLLDAAAPTSLPDFLSMLQVQVRLPDLASVLDAVIPHSEFLEDPYHRTWNAGSAVELHRRGSVELVSVDYGRWGVGEA